jgi:hypothetical protein
MSYTETHARALDLVTRKGASASFSLTTPGTYDAATDTFTTPTTATVAGQAVAIKGDPERYLGLGLVLQNAITLLFAPTTYGSIPLPGYSVTWNSTVYTAREVEPIAPDGSTIAARVVCAK